MKKRIERQARLKRRIEMKKTIILMLVLIATCGFVFATGDAEKVTVLYPTKTIQIIVPYGAGGGADISVRLMTKYLEQELGQKIVVQNVSGGSGTIGFTQLANAKPDGYTLGYFSSTQSNDSRLFQGVKYDETSFTPISLYASDPHIIVASKASGIKNFNDLIANAKAKPEGITFGLGGAWTSHDFLRANLESEAGIKFKRMVFQGGAAAVTAVAGGNCDVAVPFVSEALAQIEAGNIVPIAITSAERFESTPDIPTVIESGFNFTHTMWRAIVGPAGLSKDIVVILDNAIANVMANPDYQKESLAAGTFTLYMDNAEFSKFYLENHELYKTLIEASL